MNTPAHALIAAALLAKPNSPGLNTALVAGALFPDALIVWMFGWERFVNGLTPEQIFGHSYFTEYWQGWFAVTNSIPLYTAMAVIGLLIGWRMLFGFGAAAGVHSLLDLPLHHDDGRPHFWPFSEWTYESPVSYWDANHFGTIAGPVEMVISLAATFFLLWRFREIWVWVMLWAAMSFEAFIAIASPYAFSGGA